MADTAQQRQCGSKQIYESSAEATAQAKAMHKLYKGPFHAYACRYCNAWHVGRVRSREAAIRRHERTAA